ncbi:hypothetical protein SDRG_11258 [Saprolegnia diclina VS20]|uniref:PH domain-containing protein n=1 Tax=Saprolegnia diclina (strain VS20) TaxID=1156394 RepID=T0RM76_SAPDV|nr:hypothetical protein SDRG_11258 [Saprolegnia diclina VS20]EQC31072.1 hypothetical protein SDRG_11258 [Saprolegnia diclina VS20]|eukprot:XP_008615511.1 hypothetical protein SDRG_11258 [Saprolegnia diclina VS20]
MSTMRRASVTDQAPVTDGVLRLGRICHSYTRRSGDNNNDIVLHTGRLMENTANQSILSHLLAKKRVEPPYIDTKRARMGWLTKRGAWVKSWKSRWCVLYNGFVYYYKAPEDVNQSRMCLGVIDLMGATVEVCDQYKAELTDIPYNSFVFKIDQVATESRTFYFIAPTTRDLEEWIAGCQLDTWQPHWCTLHNGVLSYYMGTDRMAPLRLGVVYLTRCLIEDVAPDEVRYMNSPATTFKLTQLKPEERTYYFSTDSEAEFDMWMQGLRAASQAITDRCSM